MGKLYKSKQYMEKIIQLMLFQSKLKTYCKTKDTWITISTI